MRGECQREDDGDGEKDPEGAAGEVDPEVAEGLHLAARDAADEGDGERETNGGGPEVVRGEAEHLGEIAHGGLGCVGLPVGVGGEGDCSVEGEVGSYGGEVLRVEGEMSLAGAR